DAMTRQVMQEELIRIHEQSGKTTVFVTHNIDEALILADRIIVMSSRPGRMKASIRNDLPRPRQVDMQLSPRYLELKRQIWGHVEEEVRRQIEATLGHRARAVTTGSRPLFPLPFPPDDNGPIPAYFESFAPPAPATEKLE